MIIKFEDCKKAHWYLFDDVDQLSYRKLPPFLTKAPEEVEPTPLDAEDYTDSISSENCSMEGNPGRVLISFMTSKQLNQTNIIAFSPIYLMNENGKTIDII